MPAESPVLVFNPLAWERTDLVTADVQLPETEKNGISVLDPRGKPLLYQVLSSDAATHTYQLLIEAEDMPSLGYEVLQVIPGSNDARSDLHADGLTLENSLLRVSVDPHTGCITSLYDKKRNSNRSPRGRVRKRTRGIQGHTQRLRRMEY